MELDAENSDIFKCKMIEHFMDRPDKNFPKGNHTMVGEMCLAMIV